MVTQCDLVPSKRFLQHLVAKRGQSGSVECCRRRGYGRSRPYLRRRSYTRRNSATNCEDQELYGELTWCGVHFSARQSNNRLSAPVSARSCCQRVSTQNSRLCQRENIIQRLNDVQDVASHRCDSRLRCGWQGDRHARARTISKSSDKSLRESRSPVQR